MNHEPHTHHCDHCDRDVACVWAAEGGCIFPSTSGVTCNPCAERMHALTDVKLLEPYRFYRIGERAFLAGSPKYGKIKFTRHLDGLTVKDARGRETSASVMLVTESAYVPLPTPICVHSPTGLEWGYGGSGPADCAANILALFVSLPEAWRLHQDFKPAVAGICDGGEMSIRSVRLWLEQTWQRERADLELMKREAEILALEKEVIERDADLARQGALP